MRKILLLTGVLFTCLSIQAQSLAAGDIAFIGFHQDSQDGFTFITLTDIAADEVIYFTDHSWSSTDNQWHTNTGDAHYAWTVPAGGVSIGTIVEVEETLTADVLSVTTGAISKASAFGNFSLISSGDVVIAYQSTTGAVPSVANATFLAAIYMDDNYAHNTGCDGLQGWFNSTGSCASNPSYPPTGSNASGIPNGLTNGLNAMHLYPSPTLESGSQNDNGRYTGTLEGDASTILASINDYTNWTMSDGAYDISSTFFNSNTTVNVTSACTEPDVPSLFNASGAICSGNSATINITGSLNDATKWYLYSGSCGGTLVDSTSGSSFSVSPSSTTDYFVRGNGGCTTPGSCGTVEVVVNSNPTPSITGATAYCASVGSVTVSADQTYSSYSWSSGGASINETIDAADGAVTLTVTDGNSCSGISGSVTATANTNPTPSITGATAYCASAGGVTVSADQTYSSYSWSSGGASINETIDAADGAVTLTVTDGNSCSGTSGAINATESTDLSITSATSDINNVDAGTSVLLTANGVSGDGATVNWYTGTGGTGSSLGTGSSISVSPFETTQYYAYVTGTCSAKEASVTVTVNAVSFDGSSLVFDGANEYVDLTNSSTTNIVGDMTIEFWLNVNTLQSDWVRLVGRGSGNNRTYGVWIATNGQILWQRGDGVGGFHNVQTTLALETDKWYHIAAVKEGSDYRIYINGGLAAQLTSPITTAISSESTTIGYAPAMHAHLNGSMGDVRIWNGPRTQSEIRATMNTCLMNNEAGLVSHYIFEKGTGSTAYDHTSNNLHGSMQNMDEIDWVSGTVSCCQEVTSSESVEVCHGNSYMYADGTEVTNITTGTSHISNMTSVKGCDSVVTETITVNPLPTVGVSFTDTIICTSSSVTLTGTGTADTYSWDQGIDDGVSFMPIQTLIYTVTGEITATGCTADSSIQVRIDACTGLFAQSENSLEVYPNPVTSGQLFFETSLNEVSIYSLDGRLLKSYEGEQKGIDVSSLGVGTYVGKSGVYTFSFVIE
jgi:hypothetical protein